MPHTISRFGTFVPADEVFFAWTSGNLDRMLAAISLPGNAVDRHCLLQCIVQTLYRQRADSAKRKLLFEVANLHLEEMQVLIDGLRRHDVASKALSMKLSEEESKGTDTPAPAINALSGGAIPFIETFSLVVRALCEDGRYEDAKKVWRRAEEVGYLSGEAVATADEVIDRLQRRNEAKVARTRTK
jgi:pentatricopeptide repeat protein